MILSVVSGTTFGWLLLIQFWILLLWFRPGRNPFARRLDQLLALLLPGTALTRKLRGGARRWRAQLRAVYAQGYQVASETISSPGEVARGRELVQEAVEALNTERAGGRAGAPTTDDSVVVFAYGLGAWPSGVDLTSLEQLLEELGVSHAELRKRFESLIRTVAIANRNREFRELAAASFVLGAAARIVEAAGAPGRSLPPPRWLATIKTHLR